METVQDYAKLSMTAYGRSAPLGWTVIAEPTEDQKQSGFYATAYQRQGTNEIVIAFRGTGPVDDFWNDIMGADGAIATGREHQQFIERPIARRTGLLPTPLAFPTPAVIFSLNCRDNPAAVIQTPK